MQPIDILLVEDNEGDIFVDNRGYDRPHIIVNNIFEFMMLSMSSSSEDILKSVNDEANYYMTMPLEIDCFIREILSIKNLKISSESLLNS